jgi:hypothetical protein
MERAIGDILDERVVMIWFVRCMVCEDKLLTISPREGIIVILRLPRGVGGSTFHYGLSVRPD